VRRLAVFVAGPAEPRSSPALVRGSCGLVDVGWAELTNHALLQRSAAEIAALAARAAAVWSCASAVLPLSPSEAGTGDGWRSETALAAEGAAAAMLLLVHSHLQRLCRRQLVALSGWDGEFVAPFALSRAVTHVRHTDHTRLTQRTLLRGCSRLRGRAHLFMAPVMTPSRA
jgi:hypothetical protein